MSPNTNAAVIARTIALGLLSLPGCLTPTEAFTALGAGADGLKFFPADVLGSAAVAGMKAVLPKGTIALAVGGITRETIPEWTAAGVDGFGLGSALYRAGMSSAEVRETADTFIDL